MSARRALAPVLACLTTESAVEWWLCQCLAPPMQATASGVAWVHRTTGLYPLPREWREWREELSDPAEALAALVEAELFPEHWLAAARAPRWWCRCDDGRAVTDPTRVGCWRCDGSGRLIAPPSHAALVAVASLGVDALARAEAIVAETWPGRALVWRVMTRGDIDGHHAKVNDNIELTPLRAFAHEMVRAKSPERFGGEPAWPRECPWQALSSDSPTGRAYPALRAIARTEGGTPTGLHLVALDDARVVLAVEALP